MIQDLAGSVATATAAAPTPAATEVVLQTQRLTKRFGSRTAVNGLDMEVHRGDVLGLLGPNGAGKSTTLRMILGLIWPTAGSISLFGQPVTPGARRDLLQRVGAIIEQPSFYPYLSGRQNLRVVARFAGQPNTAALRSRIEDVLRLVGLHDRKESYKRYSLGMKQRLGVAAALLAEPELVILDEPTNGLDVEGIRETREVIRQLAQHGMTVVLSSHQLYEVQQVCNRVAILNFGSVIAQGRVADLLAARSGLVVGFEQPDALARAQTVLLDARRSGAAGWIKSLQYIQPEPGAWIPPDGGQVLLVDAPPERAADITALLASQGLYLSELRRSAVTLEQLFLDLTRGTNGANGMNGQQGQPGAQGGQA